MAAPQQQGNPQDSSFNILWAIAGIFAVLGMIWYAFKTQIIQFFLMIKLVEVNFLDRLFDTPYFKQLHDIILYAAQHPDAITFNQFILISTTVGNWFRVPFAIGLFALGILIYFANSTRVFRNKYDMRRFAKLERKNWPQITPVIHLDLIKTDIDSGPWAMAMNPMQFCKRHKLLDEMKAERKENTTRKDWDRVVVVLRRGKANKLFAMQLGPVWKDVNHLSPHAKALFAAFAARIAADSKGAADLLLRISASSNGKLNFSGADALLKKHINDKLVQKIMQGHAYELTVMASMLEGARQDGVQASADFLWLKPLDRRLWYTLNTVGRQTAFSEVAGIYAHWLAEKEAGRKLLVPMVDEATKALEVALKEIIYRPDEG